MVDKSTPNNYFKYFNIGEIEEKWGFYVTSAGYSRVQPKEQYPNQEHPDSHELTWNRGRILNDYYIVFISKGKGLFDSALTSPTELSEGTCFFLFPGIKHRYKPNHDSGWEEYWIGFNGFYPQTLMKSGIFDSYNPIVNVGFNKDILDLFRNLIETVKAALVGYPQQIVGHTIQILGHVNAITHNQGYNNDPVGKLISKARFIIHESFENALDMEKLAQMLPMSYSAFRQTFKRLTGESPNQYHLKLRLNRAKDLLNSTMLNINEIADQTGFASVHYFSKLFKQRFGISPKIYRTQNNLKQ